MRRDAIGLQVSLDVEGRLALLVGGGFEAEDKTQRLLDAGARVKVVAPVPGPRLEALAQAGLIAVFPRRFMPGDLHEADLLFVCERDEVLSSEVEAAASAIGVATWMCDDPLRSDMAMPALARLGRARIAVSTGGSAPALASKLRAAFERDLGARFAEFVDALGAERVRLFAEEPDPVLRRERLRALVEGFELRIEALYPGPFGSPAPALPDPAQGG